MRFSTLMRRAWPALALALSSSYLPAYSQIPGFKTIWQTNPDNSLGLGQCIADLGDINGDGYMDVGVGKPHFSNNLQKSGKVEIFYGSASGLGAAPACILFGNSDNMLFGSAVAAAGDVNGDGYKDFVVGAPATSSSLGKVFVYYGSAGLPTGFTALTSEKTGSSFGFSVDLAGDVNQDGYSDIVVGAPNYSETGKSNCGKVYVFTGSTSGISSSVYWSAEGSLANAQFGYSLAGNGKSASDSYPDILVGAPSDAAGKGEVFLYNGVSGGFSTSVLIFDDSQTGSRFGQSIAWAGDLDHDGLSDVLIGAPHYSRTHTAEGRVTLYYSATTQKTTSQWEQLSGRTNGRFGKYVVGRGRFDNDSYDDIAFTGEPTSSSGGEFFIIHGGSVGIGTSIVRYGLDPGDTWTYLASGRKGILAVRNTMNFSDGSCKLIAEEQRLWDKRGAESQPGFSLSIAPNPSTEQAVARFTLAEDYANASLIIIDALGNVVSKVFTEQTMLSGQHEIQLPVAELSSGAYQLVLGLDGQMFGYPVQVLH